MGGPLYMSSFNKHFYWRHLTEVNMEVCRDLEHLIAGHRLQSLTCCYVYSSFSLSEGRIYIVKKISRAAAIPGFSSITKDIKDWEYDPETTSYYAFNIVSFGRIQHITRGVQGQATLHYRQLPDRTIPPDEIKTNSAGHSV
jgi:hypothetical protein